ncbi:hypothetical protein P7C70_g7568, partial [Phenoliferia sp. Uapishka_3]
MPLTRSRKASLKVAGEPGSPPAEVEVKAALEGQLIQTFTAWTALADFARRRLKIRKVTTKRRTMKVCSHQFRRVASRRPGTAVLQADLNAADSDAASDEELTGKTLLTLPREILQHIGLYVAPEGGQKAGNLRLACRRLGKAMQPVVWRALNLDLPVTKLDALFACVMNGTSSSNLHKAVRSVKLRLGQPLTELSTAALARFPGIEHLHLIGNHPPQSTDPTDTLQPIPPVLAESIPLLGLRTLHLDQINLQDSFLDSLWDAKGQPSHLDSLSLSSCSGDFLFQAHPLAGDAGMKFICEVRSQQVALILDSSTASQLSEALEACRGSARDLSIFTPKIVRADDYWRELKDEDNQKWDVNGRLPYSLRLRGLPDVFRPSVPPSTRQGRESESLTHALNWVGAGPLYSLTLPVQGDTFAPHQSFSALRLPRVTHLTLEKQKATVQIILKKDLLNPPAWSPARASQHSPHSTLLDGSTESA